MPTVLILLDDLNVQRLIAGTLAKANFIVLKARTPSSALKLLANVNLPVDLLIADPTLSGLGKFIASLRQSQGYLHVLSVNADSPPMSAEDWLIVTRRSISQAASM